MSVLDNFPTAEQARKEVDSKRTTKEDVIARIYSVIAEGQKEGRYSASTDVEVKLVSQVIEFLESKGYNVERGNSSYKDFNNGTYAVYIYISWHDQGQKNNAGIF